jgi:RNA polymerase sigma-70 factor, ECF subfamily
MNTGNPVVNLEAQAWSDEDVVGRVLAGQAALFEILMRRHNQRIYRIVRGILDDDGEAEDVMQDAYVRAYQHLGQFEGRSTFVTWLTRIAMHQAFACAERLKRQTSLDDNEILADMKSTLASTDNPEQNVAHRELQSALEAAILSLPPKYRTVMMVRDVEEMSTAEAASILEISEEAVKVRLHRARALVRGALHRQSGANVRELFAFPATRCDRVVAAVLARI